jgi:hypothetical protein
VALELTPVFVEVEARLQNRLDARQLLSLVRALRVELLNLCFELGQQGVFLLYIQAGGSQLTLVGFELLPQILVVRLVLLGGLPANLLALLQG